MPRLEVILIKPLKKMTGDKRWTINSSKSDVELMISDRRRRSDARL